MVAGGCSLSSSSAQKEKEEEEEGIRNPDNEYQTSFKEQGHP